jgi:hypothetical protein
MSVISFRVIEPIAHRIREARARRQPVQLSADQVALLDEWMQFELELEADSEWLAQAVARDDRAGFVSLEEAEKELSTLTMTSSQSMSIWSGYPG